MSDAPVAVGKAASLNCWVVTDGNAGMESQCLGLAEALGLSPRVKRIRARAPWRWLTPQLWPGSLRTFSPDGDRLVPPWPDLVIATGRLSVAPVLAARRASGARIVQIQNPGVSPRRFDLVIAPEHDRLAGDNVITTLGALNRVTAARLAAAAAAYEPRLGNLPRPRVAVLLGGTSKVYRMTPRVMEGLGRQLAALARDRGFGLLVTPSRRTDPAGLAIVERALEGLPAEVWDGRGDNPYFAYLGLADAFVVTSDSVNMTCEAASTGKPVHVAALAGGSAKFRRFHRALQDAGITRPFDGEIEAWRYPPLRETARVAEEVRRRLRLGTPQGAPESEAGAGSNSHFGLR